MFLSFERLRVSETGVTAAIITFRAHEKDHLQVFLPQLPHQVKFYLPAATVHSGKN